MARATLEFDLDDQWDILAHKRACNATDAYIALQDIHNRLIRSEGPLPNIALEILGIINDAVNLDDLP